MGISFTLCIPSVSSCMGRSVMTKQGRVLRIVKIDGKILEFKAPVLVKDILVNFSGSGIGLSKQAIELLPPNYQLKKGGVYYILPSMSPSRKDNLSSKVVADDLQAAQPAAGVKRIKVVITKQQLQQLLAKQTSVGEVLSLLERRATASIDSPSSWKPKLQCIPEGSE